MATLVHYQGRKIWMNRRDLPQTEVLFTDREGNPVSPYAIPADSPRSPLRVGVPYHDATDGLTYRVVRYLDPKEGWGTLDYWLHRYGVRYPTILEWVRQGFLDAAMEEGSPTKRYRCRDEARVLAWLEKHPNARISQRSVYRHRKKLAGG
jgi:hypothetical protein